MYANGFEYVSNRDNFDFNTKTLHEILCHVVNGNPLPANFTTEKIMMPVLRMEIFQPLYSTTQPVGITAQISKKEAPMLIKIQTRKQ